MDLQRIFQYLPCGSCVPLRDEGISLLHYNLDTLGNRR